MVLTEKELKLIQKLKEIEAHLTFFTYNDCTKRDLQVLVNDINDFITEYFKVNK